MKQRGMTLIEVMTGMAILAIAGLALMKTQHEQIRNLHYLEQKQLAMWIADNQLTLTYMTSTQVSPQGEVQMAGERWVWQHHTLPTTQPGVLRVEIAVWRDVVRGTPLARIYSWVAP